MADFLQSVGQSKAGTSLSEFVLRRRAVSAREEANKIDATRVRSINELTGEQIANARNRRQVFEQEQAELNRVIPVQPLKDMFVVPEVGDFAFGLAKKHGFINPDNTMSVRNRNKMMEFLKWPPFVQTMSTMRVNHWQKQYSHFDKVLTDKEYAKEAGIKEEEAQEGKAAALVQWNAAVGANSGLTKKLELDIDAAAKAAKTRLEQDKLVQKEREVDVKEERLLFDKTKPTGGKVSDFERAYQQKKLEPGMDELNRDQFKRLYWTKRTPEAGKLTEKAVLEDIRELVDYDKDQARIWSGRFRELVDAPNNMSREKALQQVKEEYAGQSTGSSYQYLWE